ncbi:DUF4349 domain-containing protein [Natronincola ferrireducens]|uniref:Anti-sigma-W factor RsiW n=1 Tax=Natronincola ferrireducens TaxID=393762 RepID=A0A1G9A9W0_9FIRM|nr:DUF4349 domain-containing protein [Natronincola ferrireducens]SDK23614.1 Putative zinc-finger [Natronincola ferrireducens]
MDCKEFDLYVSSYVDNYLDEKEKQNFERHLQQCESCRMEYENFKMVIDTVNEIEEIPLPKNFTVELGKRLREESIPKKKETIAKKWKWAGGIAAGLALVVMSASILTNVSFRGSNSFMMKSADMAPRESAAEYGMTAYDGGETRELFDIQGDVITEEEMDKENKAIPTGGTGFTASPPNEMENLKIETARKIIQKGRISLEVENFDEVHGKVLELVKESGGYIQLNEVYYYSINRENPEESLKSGNMELRIPSTGFMEIFEDLKSLGVPIEENTSGIDITETYRDIDNQVENLKIQEERLRDILRRADRVEDLLQVENELNRIRTQINSLSSTLKSYDNLVALSTIELNIRQVKDKNVAIQPLQEGLWSRAKNNFVNSINGIIKLFEAAVVTFFGILPVLAVLAVIGGPMGYVSYKKWIKKK